MNLIYQIIIKLKESNKAKQNNPNKEKKTKHAIKFF